MASSPLQRDSPDLAATLVQIAHEYGFSVERLNAEKLLAESRHAWPGSLEDLWSKWLAEAAKSVGLQARATRLAVHEALDLVQDGATVVYKPHGSPVTATVATFDGQTVEIQDPLVEQRQSITPEEFARFALGISESEKDVLDARCLWLIIEDQNLSHETDSNFHDRPIARLFALLRPEWSDIWVVSVFALFAGVLSLATPIAVETLVNTVAFGRLVQPLIILSLMLFGFLVFASMMYALQTFVVEIIQRRLFARVAADLAYRFPRVNQLSLGDHYGPELANRFFDVVTLQKVVAQLLLDGIAIVLATVVGMAVLAFYHPWLLGFDVLLLGLIVGGVLIFGRGAIASGIDESKQKYRLAAWLQDLMRCRIGFKAAGAPEFASDRANQMTAAYLSSRRRHFQVLFRQLLFILGLQAVAGTVLLGFGGWLVIREQLTLGQLVAAELIVAMILGSLAKLGKHIEGFYDVVASVDKLGHLFDLEMEQQDGLLALRPGEAVRVRITDVNNGDSGGSSEKSFSLTVDPREQVVLHGRSFAGSTVLFDYLYGLSTPETGHIEIEHADPRDLRPDILRQAVTLVRGIEVFEGTIAENVQLARPNVSMTEVRSALYAVGLLDNILRMPNGLDTRINAEGMPLRPTELNLLMLARALAGQPRLLLIDGVFDSLGDDQLNQVCEMLRQDRHNFTLLIATNRGEVAEQFARIVDIEESPHSALTDLSPSSPDPETTS